MAAPHVAWLVLGIFRSGWLHSTRGLAGSWLARGPAASLEAPVVKMFSVGEP